MYTVPLILDPNHLNAEGEPTAVSDSFQIALYLDEKYPSHGSLIPEGTTNLQAIAEDHFMNTVVFPSFKLCTRAMAGFVAEKSQVYVFT